MSKQIFNIFFILIFLISPVSAKMLDSGKPIERIYKVEEVSEYLGKKVLIQFIDENIENYIILNIKGILISKLDNKKFLLLGKTKYKNRIVIPIEKINYIKIID
jgi:hypothetical protein